MRYELGIIGAGQMAEAIVRGALRGGLLTGPQMIAADVSDARRGVFAGELRTAVTADNAEVARQSRTVLLSVKPYHMSDVLAGIGAALDPDALVISIAAGVKAVAIERHLGGGRSWRVVRSMPNTPMLVGEGMVAIAPGTNARPADLAAARQLFAASADVIEVTEDQIDAVTALSGSGPAYFFYVVEAMMKAGTELGLSREQAHQLASKTCLGAGRMLLQSHDTPEELRRKVTTPNGTTHAAITTMQTRGVAEAVAEGVMAAERRSRELGG